MKLQRFLLLIILLLIIIIGTQLIIRQTSMTDNNKRVLPRFATLRASEVNLRRGPGKQYPSDWIYVRAGLPIEIIAEFDVWRQIRDHEGTEGWTHQSMVSGRRNIIVIYDDAKMYDSPNDGKAQVIAIVKKNAIGRVLECKIKFCKAQFADYKGWLRRQDIWSVKALEEKFK